jgi:hypothetical protein
MRENRAWGERYRLVMEKGGHLKSAHTDRQVNLSAARLSHTLHVECAAQTVVEDGDHPLNLNLCELDGRQTGAPVGPGKTFALDDACVVADRDELHLVASHLMMRAVGNDETASDDTLPGVIREITNRAIRAPCNARKLIEWMAAHGESEQFHFVMKTLCVIRFRE